MKVQGIQFIDLIDLLDKHGYQSVNGIRGFAVNPLEWPKQQWDFALDLICKSTKLTEKQVRKMKPAELLQIFNEAMRKTGLIIQLTQTTMISDRAAMKQMQRWDVIWKNKPKM